MWESYEAWVRFLGQEDPLEEGLATYSSILSWRIPWTEEPDRLQSVGVTKELDVTEVTEHTSLVTCCEMDILREVTGTSLVVQWLRLHAPNAGAGVQSMARALDPTCCN